MSEIAKHWIDGEWVGSGTVSDRSTPLPERCWASGPTAAKQRYSGARTDGAGAP